MNGSLVGSYVNVLKADKGMNTPLLQPFWCRFDGSPATAGRQTAMPHIKTYLRHSCAQLSHASTLVFAYAW